MVTVNTRIQENLIQAVPWLKGVCVQPCLLQTFCKSRTILARQLKAQEVCQNQSWVVKLKLAKFHVAFQPC